MKAECLAFLESLYTRRPPVTDGSEELRVLEVLGACERSLSNDGIRTMMQPPVHGRVKHKRLGRSRNNDKSPVFAGMAGAPV
jgi:hypothetical protein